MNIAKLLVCIAASLISLPSSADEYGMANGTVRFRVIDDESVTLDGVHVKAYDLWSAGGRYQGLTDTNGLFACYMRKIYPPISGTFKKSGYYKTQGEVWMGKFGVLPANTLTVTLKRIINPVPMVKREVQKDFPRLDVAVGFDLEIGDWVEPDGKGKRADLWITGSSRFVSRRDHNISAQLVFSNKYDGVQEFMAVSPYRGNAPAASALPPPSLAPTDGYVNTMNLSQSWEDGQGIIGHAKEHLNYIFRFRSEVDEDGHVVRAIYGWVFGNILIDINRDKPLYLKLTYYFNPDPTSRSLEPKEIADRQ
jgi:hypothetical protein